MNHKICSLLVILFLCVSSYAQNISTTITPNAIWIGDYMTLELKADNIQGKNLYFPLINDTTMGNFRLVEEMKPDTLYSGQNYSIVKKYTITCFEDSIQTFPALNFSTNLGQNLMSKPILITVNSPNIDSAKDIKPIKGIIQVPLTKSEIFSYLFVSFILLGLVLLIYFIYIKWIRKENLFDRDKPQEPPHVVALKMIKDIENETLWQKGNIKEYYDKISDTIRWYLEKRFGIKALEQTTNQILTSIEKLELSNTLKENLIQILTLADLAKFAKQNPDKEDNDAILKHSYSFVQNTQMSYDANMKANALQVRKFYGQNMYQIKPSAINQYSFKILVYGIIGTLLILSLFIGLSYLIPINYFIGLMANSPVLIFSIIVVGGIAISLIIMSLIRSRNAAAQLIFDYDSFIIKSNKSQKSILFHHLIQCTIDKKGNIKLQDNALNDYSISKNYEYFNEIFERLNDIIEIEKSKNNTVL